MSRPPLIVELAVTVRPPPEMTRGSDDVILCTDSTFELIVIVGVAPDTAMTTSSLGPGTVRCSSCSPHPTSRCSWKSSRSSRATADLRVPRRAACTAGPAASWSTLRRPTNRNHDCGTWCVPLIFRKHERRRMRDPRALCLRFPCSSISVEPLRDDQAISDPDPTEVVFTSEATARTHLPSSAATALF